MDPLYYFITFGCVAGGCFTGFNLGKRQGIENFLSFLDSQKGRDNRITIELDGESVEIVRDR